jgi:exopolyphosphatase/guanosine-5'-triphosphate,3'-diphosphate pyrophosphatase
VHATRKFHPDALKRAEECFRQYSEIIAQEKPDHVIAMATSAARDVTNGAELFALGKKYNIPVEIIPGSREAEITFRGSTYDEADPTGLAVIDVGGGSTEVIGQITPGEITGASVNVGSVRLTELFVRSHPVSRSDLASLTEYVEQKFSEAARSFPVKKVKDVLAVAGTPTTLAAVMQAKPYSKEVVHGYRIGLKDMRYWLEKLAAMTVEERQALPGMDPKRADVIVAGLVILISATELLGLESIKVSDRGVRFGVALLAEERNK